MAAEASEVVNMEQENGDAVASGADTESKTPSQTTRTPPGTNTPVVSPDTGVTCSQNQPQDEIVSTTSEQKDENNVTPKSSDNVDSALFKVPVLGSVQLEKPDNSNNEPPPPEVKPKQRVASLSPAEQLKQNEMPIPYKEPTWGGLCEKPYSFEVLKNGAIIDNVKLTTKSHYVVGRLPACDVHMEHPSLSRYHAIVQYCALDNPRHQPGWYLYDLDSTHGTTINKNRLKSRVYYRMKVGYVLKFGGSTRLHVLQGPDGDEDQETEQTVSELKEERERKQLEKEAQETGLLEDDDSKPKSTNSADTGCMWGMSDDAREVDVTNPFALELEPQNEDLYIDDPKKALKGYFEREGYDLPEYDTSEEGFGKHKCKVELPVDSPTGERVIAEVTVSGKKRDAVVQCALEACRILDRYGVLRKAMHESRAKKRQKNWEDEDYYDSDDDTFLDRTGDVERKRQQRMERLGKSEKNTETFETLSAKLQEVDSEIEKIDKQLAKAKQDAESMGDEDVDALDAYMKSIKSGAMDTKTRIKLKHQLLDLRKEQLRLQRLVNIARPASMPALNKAALVKKMLPMTGKMKGPSRLGVRGPIRQTPQPSVGNQQSDEEEEEDSDSDEEEDQSTKRKVLGPSKKTALDMIQAARARITETTNTKTKPVVTTTTDRLPIATAMDIDAESAVTTSNESAEQSKQSGDVTKTRTSGDNVNDEKSDVAMVTSSCDKQSDKSSRLPIKVSESEVVSSNQQKSPQLEDKSETITKPDSSVSLSELSESSKPAVETNKDFMSEKAASKRTRAPRLRGPSKPASSKPLPDSQYADDPDYAMWLPPENQSGDGKTSLNEKLGY